MPALWVTLVRQAGVPAIRGSDVQFHGGRISESPARWSTVRSSMPLRHAAAAEGLQPSWAPAIAGTAEFSRIMGEGARVSITAERGRGALSKALGGGGSRS